MIICVTMGVAVEEKVGMVSENGTWVIAGVCSQVYRVCKLTATDAMSNGMRGFLKMRTVNWFHHLSRKCWNRVRLRGRGGLRGMGMGRGRDVE